MADGEWTVLTSDRDNKTVPRIDSLEATCCAYAKTMAADRERFFHLDVAIDKFDARIDSLEQTIAAVLSRQATTVDNVNFC